MSKRLVVLFCAAATWVCAHPMGNFSVSHYAKFQVKGKAVDLTYALDLAELPTLDLLNQWGLDRNSPRAKLERKAAWQARQWVNHLEITSGGKPVTPKLVDSSLVIADGAGDLPILRITAHLQFDAPAGALTYEDRNYPGRAGWKEIVIPAGQNAAVTKASQGAEDRTQALTVYPQDPTVAPPQDLRASMEWTAAKPVAPRVAPVIAPIPQPQAIPTPAPATRTPQAAPPGTVVKGDYLSRLLHQRELSLGMILFAIAAAFGLGAAHALTPGHGKTIVGAYLVGSRGTIRHAAYLGAMVTFTHTISVFVLGLATLFLFQYVMPEKITQVLGVISGLSIVAIGAWMLYKRAHGASQAHHHHHDHHDHDHHHAHDHAHDHHHHDHPHVHPHVHSHGPGGHVHTHDVPDQVSWGSLTALAVSGGLVPCESALVLLLSAIALGRVGLGLMLLLAFSLGLAIVLMGIGILVIYAKQLIPERKKAQSHPALRWIPVASAAVVMLVGLLMTGVSLGWLGSGWVV